MGENQMPPTAAAARNGLATATLSQKILMAVLTGLWLALAGSYYALSSKVDAIKDDTAAVKAKADDLFGSVQRIEARLAASDTAAATAAQDQRSRAAAQIEELQARERARSVPVRR